MTDSEGAGFEPKFKSYSHICVFACVSILRNQCFFLHLYCTQKCFKIASHSPIHTHSHHYRYACKQSRWKCLICKTAQHIMVSFYLCFFNIYRWWHSSKGTLLALHSMKSSTIFPCFVISYSTCPPQSRMPTVFPGGCRETSSMCWSSSCSSDNPLWFEPSTLTRGANVNQSQ